MPRVWAALRHYADECPRGDALHAAACGLLAAAGGLLYCFALGFAPRFGELGVDAAGFDGFCAMLPQKRRRWPIICALPATGRTGYSSDELTRRGLKKFHSWLAPNRWRWSRWPRSTARSAHFAETRLSRSQHIPAQFSVYSHLRGNHREQRVRPCSYPLH